MSDLEARIARLEAIEEIRKLKARYLTCCDLKEPKNVRDCFATGEVVIDYETMGVHTKRDDFIALFEKYGCRDNIVDMHHGSNLEIDILSETHAKSRCELYFFTFDKDTSVTTQLSGIYDDEYILQDGKWKILKTVFRRVSVIGSTVTAAGEATFSLGEPAIKYN